MDSISDMSAAGSSNASKAPTSFEFTKRKKYADLLIAELTDAIQFILSTDCKILFCSPAVTDLLGWRDEDLIDGDLIELINSQYLRFIHVVYSRPTDEDRANFRDAYALALQNRDSMLCYVRLRCKSHFSAANNYAAPPQEVLFELKGHPHFMPAEQHDGDECRVFFAAAKPYPSRNTAM